MRIEFDPTNRDEATAVRAVLAALHPDAWAIGTEDGSFRIESDGRIAVSAERTVVADEHDEETNPKGVDENGEPWDARIHSTPAKTNADGTWRAKRGVTAEQVAAVRAEREAAVAAQDPEMDEYATEVIEPAQEQSTPPEPSAPVQAPTPPSGQSEAPLAPDASTATEAEKSTEQTVSGLAPVPPAPPSATTTTEAASTHGSEAPTSPSFLDVMKAITAAQKAGKVDTAKVKELCAAIGAGDSTMGLNGADKGELRVQFMALLSAESGE